MGLGDGRLWLNLIHRESIFETFVRRNISKDKGEKHLSDLLQK